MDFLSAAPRQRYLRVSFESGRVNLLVARIYDALTGFRSGSSSELVPFRRENA